MRKFQAVIESQATKAVYTAFIKANSELLARREIIEVIDDLSSYEPADTLGDYVHSIKEVAEFPKLPKDTVWTKSQNGSEYTFFKKIN